MKQFAKILKFEIKNYLTNKIFMGVTVFLVVLITLVMFFPRIAQSFDNSAENNDAQNSVFEESPDAGESPQDLPLILLICPDEYRQPAEQAFSAAFPAYKISDAENAEQVKELIGSGEAECAFEITGPLSYTYYVNNLSIYDVKQELASEALLSVYRSNALLSAGLSQDEIQNILSAYVESDVLNLGKDQMQNFFYTYIMIFALYMVILLYGQMVATNVATEKSSRAMELLITSAKPAAMMFGKVIASCFAGLLQLLAVFGSAILFFNINKSFWSGNNIIESIFGMPVNLFIYLLVFFILGFFIYAFMYGAVGSTASKLEDINTSVMPVTLLFIAGFFVVMFSMTSGTVDSALMKICSFVPFTSPMAMFTRIAMSNVPLYEILISIAILLISVIGVGILAAKIYRVGVLLYGTTPKISSIIKAIKKS